MSKAYQTRAQILLATAGFCDYVLSLVCTVRSILFPTFGRQYQCNQLPGKTHPRNELLCVTCDVKPYTLTHSLPLLLVLVSINP